MAVITMPEGLIVIRQSWGQKRFDLRFANGDTGAGQSRILAPPRWTASIASQNELSVTQSAIWRTMILALDGQVNQLEVYDLINAAPQGTVRGVLSLDVPASPGDNNIRITGGVGQAGKTLISGDWLGIGTGTTKQLLSVAGNATTDANGTAVVSVKPNVRWLQATGTAVIWDKPAARFRTTSDNNTWTAQSINQGGYSLDLMESWE